MAAVPTTPCAAITPTVYGSSSGKTVSLADDMIVEILSKLPVKSLLRFSCASKTWYDIISDPQFSNDLRRTRPSVLIIEDLTEFSTVTIESLLTKDGAPALLPFPWEEETEQPVVGGHSEHTCIGSSNGLICVDHKNGGSGSSSGLIICNPSTRKFKRLARPGCYLDRFKKRERPPDMWTYAWFGYHESIDDYKLVWLNFSHFRNPGPAAAKLDVFTLKSNTWRSHEVDHIPVHSLPSRSESVRRYHPISTRGVLCNNAIHWITYYSGLEICILVLDLATEKFRLLKFPHGELYASARLGSLEGGEGGGGGLWLCNHNSGVANVWMMKEYGVEPTWTKLLSIRQGDSGYDGFIRYPILFSTEREKEKEGKEMVVICHVHRSNRNKGGIVKLRVEEGGEKVKNEEMLLCLPPVFTSNVILHMEESLVSIYPFPCRSALPNSDILEE